MWATESGAWNSPKGDRAWAGGTPSKGTPKDKRLKENQ